MKLINTKTMRNLSGAATYYGDVLLVTEDSVWAAVNGYTYYAHHVTDASGNIVFKRTNANDSFFITQQGRTIQTIITASGSGTYYINAY